MNEQLSFAFRNINSKESLLKHIQEYYLLAQDISITLDTNPNDYKLTKDLNDINVKLHHLITEYESKFGPLSMNSKHVSEQHTWVKGPWPWEVHHVDL